MPIMFVDGMHVTTVEGLSDWKPSRHAPLHPIQTALANGGGTQCGFCSPGMVMAMHAIALSGTSSADNVDSHLDGNLCRCTGYRPIIQAARRLLATPENKSSDHRVASPEIHSSLGDIEDTQTEFPQSTLISGNTSIGIGSILSDPVAHSVIICVSRVTELHCSATTLSVLEQVLPELISGLEAHKTQSVQALLQVIKKFGNCQIRNVATIGGNIATASPVSDICPLLLATGATLEIQSVSISPPDCYGLQSSEVNFELVEKNGNSIVSTPLPHISSLKHVTGSALYTADVNCADVVHAAFIQSSQAHALIISIDKQKALSVPGVIAIFTSKDVPGTNLCGPVVADEELFASREVLCVGYPIGIVVATTQQIARRAAKLVEVTYESLPAILTIEEAIKLNSTLCEPLVISRGDVSLGFQEASQIISGDVSISGQEHFYIEPHATLVLPNLDSGIVVWSTTQNPSLIQSLISTTCGIASSKICVKCTQLGGGFGGKETRNGFIASACAVAATILNRQTKFVVDRDVDMSITGNRHPYLGKYKMGFNSSGQILSYEVDFFSNAGYSCDRSPSVMEQSIKCCPGPYYIPNVKATGHVMRTNRPSNTAFRGFGTPQALATLEEAVCKVASVLGTTPERIREVNFYREGQLTLYNQQLTDFTLPAIWASLLEKSDFRTRQIAIETYNATHRFSKRGISTLPTLQTVGYSEEFLNQAGALVNIYTDGSVMISHGGCEIGQGLHTKMAQIAASVLDVPIEYIHVGETSTDKVPNATSTAASSGADLNGRAVLHACSLLKNRLSTFKQSLGSEAASLSWGKLVEKAYFGRVDLSARGFTQVHGSPYYYHVYGAACSEVEIDVLTGDHTVLRSDIVVDAGVSINPVIDIGQVEGAFLQGQGWCTTEEVVTLRDGNIHTKGPSTYKVPAFCDVPRDFRVSLFPSHPRNFICLSSKGIGETPFYLGASVFFALQEAVTSARRDEGITGFYQLPHPATCEHIRLACRDSFTDLTPNGGVEGPSWSLDEFTLPPDILIQSTPPQSLP
ncbi:xanthine dehydrogenase [Pelomyxa schiedti]|nr:xanthine dehydrogenase [Pelomyxa schiedti]